MQRLDFLQVHPQSAQHAALSKIRAGIWGPSTTSAGGAFLLVHRAPCTHASYVCRTVQMHAPPLLAQCTRPLFAPQLFVCFYTFSHRLSICVTLRRRCGTLRFLSSCKRYVDSTENTAGHDLCLTTRPCDPCSLGCKHTSRCSLPTAGRAQNFSMI
jgi:hypothetical protein